MQISSTDIYALVGLTSLIFLIAPLFLILYVSSYNRKKRAHAEEKEWLRQNFENELLRTQMEVQEQTLQNINAVLESNDHTAFVAEYENKIVGWIGASQAIMIEVMPHCEINGLVIDQDHRGMGIGKLLIDKVKQWAREKNN